MKKNLKAESSSNDNYLTNVKETLCGFAARHIGLSADDVNHMLDTLGYKDIDAFTEAVVPKNILNNDLPDIGEPLSEQSALKKLKEIAKKNRTKIAISLSDSFIVKDFKNRLLEWLEIKIDYLFCNEEEAKAFSNSESIETSADELQNYAETSFITLGKEGAIVNSKK